MKRTRPRSALFLLFAFASACNLLVEIDRARIIDGDAGDGGDSGDSGSDADATFDASEDAETDSRAPDVVEAPEAGDGDIKPPLDAARE